MGVLFPLTLSNIGLSKVTGIVSPKPSVLPEKYLLTFDKSEWMGSTKLHRAPFFHPVETSVVFILTLPLNAMRPFPPN